MQPRSSLIGCCLGYSKEQQTMGPGELYFTYSGRINRKKFWLGYLALVVLSLIGYYGIVAFLGEPFGVANLEEVANGAEPVFTSSTPGLIGYGILTLATMFMSFGLIIKRCHDRGKSGWWSLLILVPIVGAIWMIIDLGVMEGDEGTNQYGPNPLAS
jgi:uncharacterized membrane protein YhaH (DUF805 family)